MGIPLFDHGEVFGEVHESDGVENDISTERVSVTVWKAATGEILQDIVLKPIMYVSGREALRRPLVSVMAMSNDRRLLALTRRHGESNKQRPESTPIEIWEVASGAKRGELTGHGPIADLAFSPDNRCLASSSDDTTILIWDLNRPLQPLKHAARLTQQELDECWRTLFEPSAAKADSAIWKFVRCPDDSLPYLKKKLRAAPVPDAGRVRNLIANLDSADFRMRTQADQELAKFGELILPHIDKAIKEAANLELRRRLEVLAKAVREGSRPFGSMTRIGEWRALEILEKIERPQAIEVLRGLANGCPDSQLTIAAKGVLHRAETRAKGGGSVP